MTHPEPMNDRTHVRLRILVDVPADLETRVAEAVARTIEYTVDGADHSVRVETVGTVRFIAPQPWGGGAA